MKGTGAVTGDLADPVATPTAGPTDSPSTGATASGTRTRSIGDRLRGVDADTWVLVAGCAFAVVFTVWLLWDIWQPGVPFGDDNAAHVTRTDFAIDQLFSRGRIDGWHPTFGLGYQEFLFVGPTFQVLAFLVKVLSLGTLSNLAAFKAAVVLSFVALPPAVAFLAWSFGLGRRAAGIAAVLSLLVNTPVGGAGVAGVFETGLVTAQLGTVFWCLALGGIILILRRPSPGRIVFTGAALALVLASHILTAIFLAFFVVAVLISASFEWLLVDRLGGWRGRRRQRRARAAEVAAGAAGGVGDEVPASDQPGELRRMAVEVWERGKALALSALLAAGLAGFAFVPLLMHGNLRGVSTAFPDVVLSERLPAIWKGDFLLRPYVAIAVVVGLAFELVMILRRRRLALTLLCTPIVFLVIARLFIRKMPGIVLAIQLTNRSWNYVGLLAILPLAHLLSWWGGKAVGDRTVRKPARRSSVVLGSAVPLVLAMALVVFPPRLERESVKVVQPTPEFVEVVDVLRQVVPDGARFATQRLPGKELKLTGMTHPDFWLAAASQKNTLNIWNPESSSVYGPVFEAERMTTEPPDAEADRLARYGVSHVVMLQAASALNMVVSPRFRQVWAHDDMRVYEVLPVEGHPSPASLVATEQPASARLVASEPEHLQFEVTNEQPTAATLAVAWSPKWHLRVNGQPVETRLSDERLIAVDLPAGTNQIELTYAADGYDWLGRLLTVVSVAAVIWWAVRRHRARRAGSVDGGEGTGTAEAATADAATPDVTDQVGQPGRPSATSGSSTSSG